MLKTRAERLPVSSGLSGKTIKRMSKKRSDDRDCPHCDGTGEKLHDSSVVDFIFYKEQSESVCLHCNGTGERLLYDDLTDNQILDGLADGSIKLSDLE
tara:strand:- start:589 stop:882 length:294 start_codon:yes stop_codon:yes gene_type:complete